MFSQNENIEIGLVFVIESEIIVWFYRMRVFIDMIIGLFMGFVMFLVFGIFVCVVWRCFCYKLDKEEEDIKIKLKGRQQCLQ